jgi:hypothetical protein
VRRTALFLAAATATALLSSAPGAQASVTCEDVGPVPGYGPVCTVTCALKTQVDPAGPRPVTLDTCWYQD